VTVEYAAHEAGLPGIVGARMAERRWRAADILRLGIGEGQQLVYTRATRTAQVLPRSQSRDFGDHGVIGIADVRDP